MLDADDEKEEEVMGDVKEEHGEILHKKEPSTKVLSNMVASLVTVTDNMTGMNFQQREETISHLKKATAILSEKTVQKFR